MRLFVFDVDGTLVGRDQILKDEIINKINNLLDDGDVLAIASGRPYSGIMKYLNMFKKGKKFAICANGALVSTLEGETLFLSALTFKDFIDYRNRHPEIINYENANCYTFLTNGIGYFKFDKYVKVEVDCNGNFTPFDLNEYKLDLSTPILKFMVASDKEFSKKVEANTTKEEKDTYQVVRTAPIYYEFINKNTDKAVGVEFLRNYLHIDKQDVFTFGDSGNDYLMIKNFNGIAMGNASDECKSVAKFITKSFDENGIIYALENFVERF